MKLQNFNFRKLILFLVVVLITACFVYATNVNLISSTSIPIIDHTPTLVTKKFAEGKIAFVYVNEHDSDIYMMNVDGSDLKNLTATLLYSRNPAWSPDRKYIAFNSPANGIDQIYSMQADGSELRQLTFDKSHSYNPVWSFDGKYIIFLSQRDDVLNDRGISVQQGYVIKSDGSEQRRFTNDQEFVDAVSWYIKGNFISVSIAYTRYTLKTYIMDLDGAIQDQFPEFIIDGVPAWSPNGELIVFNAARENCSGIILAKTDGSDQTCLIIDMLNSPVRVGGVSWSPDSEHIIFSSNLDGDFDLYLVKIDGSGLVKLTDMPGDEGTPVWSANP